MAFVAHRIFAMRFHSYTKLQQMLLLQIMRGRLLDCPRTQAPGALPSVSWQYHSFTESRREQPRAKCQRIVASVGVSSGNSGFSELFLASQTRELCPEDIVQGKQPPFHSWKHPPVGVVCLFQAVNFISQVDGLCGSVELSIHIHVIFIGGKIIR